jgi:hypothetical protein
MKRILVIAVVLLSLGGVIWLTHSFSTWQLNAKTSKFNIDVENLFVGLQQFKEHVGSYPTGNNADILKALQGQNSKNLIVLVGRKSELNSKGEIVDPWGTPLRIYFSGTGILIRSAGPNRRFDDSTAAIGDDYFRSN